MNATDLAPASFKRYFEPFLGSGAMFFRLRPKRATLSDANIELINCYRQIQSDWAVVWAGLKRYVEAHSREFYYKVRDRRFTEDRKGAVRFLYLNRACFNGIYRVNRYGRFNVPIGSKEILLYDYDDFSVVAEAIRGVKFECADFETIVARTRKEDFLFCDPPYTVTHNGNGFIKYNDKLFRWDDQIRLRNALMRAADRGVFVLLSNADFSGVRDLYKRDGFTCTPITRLSTISGKVASRQMYQEVLISNYPLRIPEFAAMQVPVPDEPPVIYGDPDGEIENPSSAGT
jgi:DNA adenine methylase